uniref:Protein CUSTOS n=1 Tax=Takifugu rubripes TaxID=31033 RepID=A0A674MVW4_TAKRU
TPRVLKMAADSDESSSSDEEALRRCQEAVWETKTDQQKGAASKQLFSAIARVPSVAIAVNVWIILWARRASTVPSIVVYLCYRVVVIEHEHDGNELQVSQGFRTHVARKLEHLLDRLLRGVRLFPAPGSPSVLLDKKVVVRIFISGLTLICCSDSDSEMETRIKEAAVSIEDLLPSTAVGHSEKDVLGKVKRKKKR